jgi:hypothetical protein
VGVATKPRSAIVFLMILAVFLPQGFPAGDVPDTAYDESEAPPYEGTSPFSVVVPSVNGQSTQELASSVIVEPGAPSMFAPARLHDHDVNRSTDARVSLALLCTLLC